MNFACCVILKIVQLFTTLAALLAKKLSDSDSNRVLIRNKKNSSEWMLLNNLSWSNEGNDFSIFTFIGYLFITGILLLSRFFIKNTVYSVSEKLFLFFGVIFFALEGVFVFSSVEYLHFEIQKYALILGGLSFLGSLLYLIDMLVFGKDIDFENKIIQTESPVFIDGSSQANLVGCMQNYEVKRDNLKQSYLKTDL